MDPQTVVTVLLLSGALLASGIGWATLRPLLWAAAAVLLLATAALLAALSPEFVDDGRGWVATITILGTMLAVAGGGPLTRAVFQLVDGTHENEDTSMQAAGAVLRGGAWIGALERGAVFVTVVGGWQEGLAVVLGLKALGRYPELRNQERPGTAERFIIGTFTSVLWAVACAGTTLLLT